MSYQIILNMILALTWMFLTTSATGSSFVIGYLLGAIILYLFRRFFDTPFYLRKVVSVVKLLLIFIRELLIANLDVFKAILRPKLELKPGIFSYETTLKKDWQITLLANMITLTPGTLVMEISPDNQTLYIHALNIGEIDEMTAGIRDSFERVIKEVSE
ncbi:Na+/H+ antiporter subunit E [Pradoshia eiseniae]|uniref:Na+/H+ antiporter subunit E n=1 Tax=Pradoshia eiseniae TaxID=2064768 RepID=A0A2S7MZG9_9BACI|nr:Na+/H+ antiporter subunit E [Pradoshia eiseniae]PQD95166.1 Na+/H+ antiporter subunit E [Pradoshia eiseniae]